MMYGGAIAPFSITLYEHFLEEVELRSHRLEWDPALDQPEWWANYGYSWAHPPAPQGNVVIVKVHVELKSPLLTRRPVDLKFTLSGLFEASRELEHAEAENFAGTRGLGELWPYVQEATRTFTERAGGPAFILGPLQLSSEQAAAS